MTAPPFSDSTSGEMFIANRCAACIHRGVEQAELDAPCSDFTPAFLGQWPEILYRSDSNVVGVECRKFVKGDPVPELSPTQVALRELMILTKCYCDGEHPRLGHNCSFRRDVETVVYAISEVLKLCEESEQAQHDYVAAVDVRRALLGLGATEDTPPASPAREELAPFSAQLAARLQAAAQPGQATPTEDEAGRPPTR